MSDYRGYATTLISICYSRATRISALHEIQRIAMAHVVM